MKNNLRFKSIRFKLFAYFIAFAVILTILIWILQIFFLDTYYEDMKLKETDRMARTLVQQYQSNGSMTSLADSINELTQDTDTFIRVETADGKTLITPEYFGYRQFFLYRMQAATLREQLLLNDYPSYSEVTPSESGEDNTSTLSYVCYLKKEYIGDTNNINLSKSYLLYMFTPLYPVASTISILRTQLIYITVIALLLATSMAIYMATHISKPIKAITQSAAEMGKGNYGVQFHGGHYEEITELAETLTHASRELEKSDMYQKDLIANVSHDLRTPLTMIKSYAEMIRDLSGDNPEKREQHLNVIIDETDRLNVLVDDMLNMSRMQQRVIELEPAEFDLSETVASLLTSYDILEQQEGYTFSYANPGKIMVKGDEAKIKQVINNLVNNAVKYCGEDKVIDITLERQGKKARLEVTDHGQGIAPDELSHVWERYYKSSTHHVRPTEGSGLGLSIVKEILTLHKAEYGVTSELGSGSTFWFEMDLVKPPKQSNKAGSKSKRESKQEINPED